MSFYQRDPPSEWGAPARQTSWEQQMPPPSRSGTASVASNEPTAFLSQIDEIERAIDNLVKSGKYFPGMSGPGSFAGAPGRRDSMPVFHRPYSEQDSRSAGSSRHHSISEYDARPGSSTGLQGYYAAQRFQQPRQNEQDSMAQAKRRMAAQRERELRNYHQEQQYNRNVPGSKPDRPASPNSMNEEERRDLIARQHRALYGNESALYPMEGHVSRSSQDARISLSAGPRGPSPLTFDAFGMQKAQAGAESAVQMPSRDQASSVVDRKKDGSPNSAGRTTFGMTDSVTQLSSNPAASPTTSPSLGSGMMPSIATQGNIGTIGSRPGQHGAPGAQRVATPNERSTASPSLGNEGNKTPSLGGWGSSSGVWGSSQKNPLGVQASVWG